MTKRTLAGILLAVAFVTITTLAWLDLHTVNAAPVDVEECEHVATAATIEIYFCEGIDLFVNQLGFMVFEP